MQPDITLPKTPAVKEYVAIMTQSATSAPTATILKNNIGNIVWTRSDAGTYIGTLTNSFSITKDTIQTTLHPGGDAQIIRAAIQNDDTLQILTISHDDTPNDNNSWYITINQYNV